MDELKKKERTQLKISVRNLVEFILRSGDLDLRRGGRSVSDAMQAGSRLHRRIQRQKGSQYQAEVPLKIQWPMEGFDCLVEGRADGIFTEDGETWIDEIKGVYRDLRGLEEAVPVHVAQAKCYAYIYAGEKKLEQIGVQMTYCNLETEEKRYFREVCSFTELEQWFTGLMEEYEKWAVFQNTWRQLRTASIEPLEFPFAYREGQRELAVSVYRAAQRQCRLFIQAPTGVGKTMSAVFPAVKAMGEGLTDRLFYLTAKTITRTVAAEAFTLLRKQKLRFKSVILTAREKVCIWAEDSGSAELLREQYDEQFSGVPGQCDPENCPYAKGHFDRINDAVYDLITTDRDELTREAILEQAHKWKVCPFELSLDLSDWCDGVICDYNYVFDPNVRLKRFFAENVRGEYLFLIDEAHNLVERGRQMFSAALYKEDFLAMKRQIKGRFKKLEKKLEKCNKYLLTLKRESEDCQVQADISFFARALLDLMGEMENLRDEPMDADASKLLSELYLQVRHFLNMYERMDGDYIIYSELEEDGRFKVKLYCVETAGNLRECLDKGIGAVFFSATLLPVSYYKHLLGDEQDYAVYTPSPFPTGNRLLAVARDVSSRYSRRTEQEYQRIADYIHQTVSSHSGNYLIFFPSYRMLRDVYTLYEQKYAKVSVQCILQTPGMTEKKREEFIAAFSGGEREGESLLGFCIMGGIFSEGIDLKYESLIGSIIVGTGLPQVCRERELLRQFYEERKMDGFAYAYQFPGMNKVLQAAGRVIRTAEDRGVILLLDERFLQPAYQRLFPREWADHEQCRLDDVYRLLEQFWKKLPQMEK